MNDLQERLTNSVPKPLKLVKVVIESASLRMKNSRQSHRSQLSSTKRKVNDVRFTAIWPEPSGSAITANRAEDWKIQVFWIALGVLSLGTGSLFAQSGKLLTERVPQFSSTQQTENREVTLTNKADDLPEAPQPTPPSSSGPRMPPGMGRGPLMPQTFHEKFMAFAVQTVGPRALVGPAFPAAIRMANPPNHYPPEWRRGAEAFGRNYGDQLATVATIQTGRFVVGAALHEDLRYHPSTSRNPLVRTGHAVAFSVFDRSDSGHVRPALANFVGYGGGSYVGMAYLPTGFDDVAHANQRLVFQFSRLIGTNIGSEFAPDIFRFLAEHHLPIPKIPIPEWWTGR
jgi:hypothetical protein